MPGIVALKDLLDALSPVLLDPEYVFCHVPDGYALEVDLDPVATVAESEGLTLVVERQEARNADLAGDGPFRRITLGVQSSLDAVGLTAAVANQLASRGISANVVSGYHHDHVFVPSRQADAALRALNELADRSDRMVESTKPDRGRSDAVRKNIASGSPFERAIGFSRAVRVGPIVAVSGTAPIAEDGGVAAPGDVYGQTRRCLEIIAGAVADAGLPPTSVFRTRVMLTDISRWEEAARAHREAFPTARPASTFVGVGALIDPAWLVEIEADCIDEDWNRPSKPPS